LCRSFPKKTAGASGFADCPQRRGDYSRDHRIVRLGSASKPKKINDMQRPSVMCIIGAYYTHIAGNRMRTNIVIDDSLMKKAMRASGARTKREAVEKGLKLMVRLSEQARAVRSLRGKLHWEGDLEAMRLDQPAPR
jgi:Arc/MetJ family transcription regulator